MPANAAAVNRPFGKLRQVWLTAPRSTAYPARRRGAAMKSFDKARDRLDKAIDRLEAAAASLSTASNGDADIKALKAERDQLAATLDNIQRKHADLHTASEAVSMRLDSAIGRMRSVLEE
jgi:prefoldin subunit 5